MDTTNQQEGYTFFEPIKILEIGVDSYFGDCSLRYSHDLHENEQVEWGYESYEYLCLHPDSRKFNNVECWRDGCPLSASSLLIRYVTNSKVKG